MNLKLFSACSVILGTSLVAQSQQLVLSENNIDEVLNSMTLQEKAALLVGGGNKGFAGDNSTIGKTENLVPGAAGTTVAIPRLGISETVLTDGPAGVRIEPTRKNDPNTYYATGFPVGVSLASSWNVDLVESVGEAMGNEVLEYGCDVLLAPGMNIHRSPLCGRNFEYYSEDPVVAGKIAAAFVKGIQSNGVGTSLKHYAANSQETNRTEVDEIVSPRALRELYLKGFEIAVKESSPWTVMSSYNRLNGPYTQENKELLTTVLRDEWGFDGIVMTDWIGQRNTADQIKAGNDLMEPGMKSQYDEIIAKVNTGELSEDDVDTCVRRMLQYIVKTPRHRGYKYSNNPDLTAHAAVTRKAATEGMVLLKNNGNTLPLEGVKDVALFGVTSYDFIGGGMGSGNVNKPYVVDLTQGFANAGLSLSDNLQDLYRSYIDYEDNKLKAEDKSRVSIWGRTILGEMPVSRKIIDLQADSCDVAILTIGRQAGEDNDRRIDNDFNLTDLERRMLGDICDAFHAKGKKVVVILNMGGVMETASWKNLPDAILLVWMPGQEGGNSVVDVLLGKANPSGKLTMTWPVTAMDHPSSLDFPLDYDRGSYRRGKNIRNVDYTLHKEGINVGYRYFDTAGKDVSYPFGFGLSYTEFSYSKPIVKRTKDGFVAEITVTNTGKVAGKEIVQLYVSAPGSSVEKPAKELKAFAKTRELLPGESQKLTFEVNNYDLASYHEDIHSWVADKGLYKVQFGASVSEIVAQRDYRLANNLVWETNDVLHATKEL